MVKRAYRYRFYPTPEQAGLLNRMFGSVRYVYNRALAERWECSDRADGTAIDEEPLPDQGPAVYPAGPSDLRFHWGG